MAKFRAGEFWLVFGFLALAAGNSSLAHARSSPTRCTFTELHGVPTNLTVATLKSLPYPVVVSQLPSEGEYLTKALIKVRRDVEVEVLFDSEGKLYRAETSSKKAVGPRGIGVGATLKNVEKAWPNGNFVFGREDGLFATYVTGTNLVYTFTVDEQVLERLRNVSKSGTPELRVARIRIFPFSVRPPSDCAH